ncbi:MAG: hypothetical protein SNJ78_06125 [Spirochaetales bacterium]
MKRRKVLIFIGMLFYGLSLSLYAETILVSLKGEDGPVLSAIEGGAMDVLFDAGFIVFNGVIRRGEGVYPPLEDFKIAKEGGASLLFALEVTIQSQDTKSPSLPSRLEYQLIRVADRKTLVRGQIENIPKAEEEAWEVYAERWGKEAANRIVKGFK